MRGPLRTARRDGRDGQILVVAVVLVLVLAVTAASVTSSTHRVRIERESETARTRVRYAAEGVLHEGWARLRQSGFDGLRDADQSPWSVQDVEQRLRVTYGDADATLGDDLVRVAGVATHGDVTVAVELVARRDPAPAEMLTFGDRGVVLRSNTFVDSWDSAAGTFASQVTGTVNGNDTAGDTAAVGSNRAISLDSNAAVRGDAVPGPGWTATTAGSSTISGSRTPAAAVRTLPAVTVPSLPDSGDRTFTGGSATLGPGAVRYDDLRVDSNAVLTVTGPATVVCSVFEIDSNARVVCDTTNGPVRIFVTSAFDFESNGVLEPASGRPRDLWVLSDAPATATLSIDSNFRFVGRLYAPAANVVVPSNAEVLGSVVAGSLTLDSNARVHADLDLLRDGGTGAETATRLFLRDVPAAEAETLR